jgi:hypothetical protein
MIEGPPFVGALLRPSLQRLRVEIQEAALAVGCTDLLAAIWAVLSYPPPDGVRPPELARWMGATLQATNRLIGQPEAMGCLDRRGDGESGRRLVWLLLRTMRRLTESTTACARFIAVQQRMPEPGQPPR